MQGCLVALKSAPLLASTFFTDVSHALTRISIIAVSDPTRGTDGPKKPRGGFKVLLEDYDLLLLPLGEAAAIRATDSERLLLLLKGRYSLFFTIKLIDIVAPWTEIGGLRAESGKRS
jgi:hypothetical protein